MDRAATPNRVSMLLGLLLLAWPAAGDANDRTALKLSPAERKVLDLTNQVRKEAKLPPLRPNLVLFAVARRHTANMVNQGKREHVLDGKDIFDRLDAAGYNWASAGENLATSRKRPAEDVMKGWMASPGHRENILKAKYQEIGIGVMADARGVVYYTQVFGRERAKK
jgi:uncharacterized protein YkwD